MVEELLLTQTLSDLFETLNLGGDSNMPGVVDNGGLVSDTLVYFVGLDLWRLAFLLITGPICTLEVLLLFEFHKLFHAILLIIIIFDAKRILVLFLSFLFSELSNLFLLLGEFFSEEATN